MTALPITPGQVWTARELLRWSRDRLSAESDVSYSFIVNYERSGLVARLFSRERGFDALAAVRAALEAAGVEFTNGDQPSVRLAKLSTD
ncbi:MAG: hypothetical protein ACRYG8_02310 [Janthinobacterium lividum]